MKRALWEFFGTQLRTSALSALILALAWTPTLAQKKYDPGVSDTEIKIGNIMLLANRQIRGSLSACL